MKRKLIGALLSTCLILTSLTGCFGGDEEEKKVEFNPTSFINNEESDALVKIEKQTLDKNKILVKSADYVIENIMFTDENRDYLYPVLRKNIDEVLRDQITYSELHRNYMKYLEENNASREELLFQNRLFFSYIKVYSGQKFNEKRNVKLILERNFHKYAVKELETIQKGESIAKFVKEYRDWEESIGLWDWYKKPEVANFKGDILVKYNIKADSIGIEEKDGIIQILSILNDVNILMEDYTVKDEKTVLPALNNYKNTIDKVILNKNNDWIKERAIRQVDYYTNYIKVAKSDMFTAADEKFFVQLERMEDIVALYLVEKQNKNIKPEDNKKNNSSNDSDKK